MSPVAIPVQRVSLLPVFRNARGRSISPRTQGLTALLPPTYLNVATLLEVFKRIRTLCNFLGFACAYSTHEGRRRCRPRLECGHFGVIALNECTAVCKLPFIRRVLSIINGTRHRVVRILFSLILSGRCTDTLLLSVRTRAVYPSCQSSIAVNKKETHIIFELSNG